MFKDSRSTGESPTVGMRYVYRAAPGMKRYEIYVQYLVLAKIVDLKDSHSTYMSVGTVWTGMESPPDRRATAIYEQQSKMSQMEKKSPLETNPPITFLIDKITLGMNHHQLSSTLIHPHPLLLTTRIPRGSVITIFIGGPFNPFGQGPTW